MKKKKVVKKNNDKKLNFINKIDAKQFAIYLTAVFAIVVGIGMHYHELWRDELNIFARAAYTDRILMEGDISYIVYYSAVKLFMLINNSQASLQILHLIIIVASIFIFNFYSTISNIQKLLFTFGYFFVFEYGVISRYYGFAVLLIFWITFLLTRKKTNYFILAILLIILANHSIQYTIFAASISFYVIFDLLNKKKAKKLHIHNKTNFIIGSSIFIIGWITILLSLYFVTYANSAYFEQANQGIAPIFMTIKTIWNSYLPIPYIKSGINFWGTNIMGHVDIFPNGYNYSDFITVPTIFGFIFSLIILFTIVSKFSKNIIVLFTFLLNTFVYLLFLHLFLKIYFLRYQGILFVIFVYCYWLYSFKSEEKIEIKLFKGIANYFRKKFFTRSAKLFYPMLYIILSAQVFTSFYALSKDIKYKFTLSQDAAKYITDNNLQKTHTMVGFMDFIIEPIAAHTKTKVFFPQSNSFSFYHEVYNLKRKPFVPITDVFNSCTNFTEKQHKKVLLILNFPLTDNNQQPITEGMLSNKTSLKFLQSFTGKILRSDEQYFLYEVKTITN